MGRIGQFQFGDEEWIPALIDGHRPLGKGTPEGYLPAAGRIPRSDGPTQPLWPLVPYLSSATLC